jgi:hypothetical protein
MLQLRASQHVEFRYNAGKSMQIAPYSMLLGKGVATNGCIAVNLRGLTFCAPIALRRKRIARVVIKLRKCAFNYTMALFTIVFHTEVCLLALALT